jgi:hypothetical protein
MAYGISVGFSYFAGTVWPVAQFVSLGNMILRTLHVEMSSEPEHVLLGICLGVLVTEILLFLMQLTQHVRLGSWAVAAVLAVVLLTEQQDVRSRLRSSLQQMVPPSRLGRFLLVLIALVACWEFLVAMAPLTGSDALNYHFAAQKLILQHGYHPDFSVSPSFLCGQHHLLILFGLAVGGEQLALGLIFLGGILTVSTMACLMSEWVSPVISAAFSLLFLLTPVVFWQISSSGSPDIYMAFVACATVMVLREPRPGKEWQQITVAGFLAGRRRRCGACS